MYHAYVVAMILTVIMCTYHTGDNHSGPCVLGAGGVVRMYYSHTSASCVHMGANNMSQPMTSWWGAAALLLTKVPQNYTFHSVVFCDYV